MAIAAIDANSQPVSVATLKIGNVEYPLNIAADQYGNPISYSDPALIGGPYNSGRSAKTSGTYVYTEHGKYGEVLVSDIDDYTGATYRSFLLNGTYAVVAGSSNLTFFSQDVLKTVASIGMRFDAVKNGYRKDALPSRTWRLNSSAAGDSAVSIWTSSGMILKRLTGVNKKASDVWIKLYDKATNAPVSTDTPILVYMVPPGPFNIPLDDFVLQNGLGIRIVGGEADGDTTALVAGDVKSTMITFST